MSENKEIRVFGTINSAIHHDYYADLNGKRKKYINFDVAFLLSSENDEFLEGYHWYFVEVKKPHLLKKHFNKGDELMLFGKILKKDWCGMFIIDALEINILKRAEPQPAKFFKISGKLKSYLKDNSIYVATDIGIKKIKFNNTFWAKMTRFLNLGDNIELLVYKSDTYNLHKEFKEGDLIATNILEPSFNSIHPHINVDDLSFHLNQKEINHV